MENKHLIIIILVLAIIEVCIMGGYAFYVGTSQEDTNKVVEDNNSYEINSTTDVPDTDIVETEDSSNDGLSEDGYSYYPSSSNAPDVDYYGVSREYAESHNMRYIPLETEDGDFGGYTTYDPINKCYHT